MYFFLQNPIYLCNINACAPLLSLPLDGTNFIQDPCFSSGDHLCGKYYSSSQFLDDIAGTTEREWLLEKEGTPLSKS